MNSALRSLPPEDDGSKAADVRVAIELLLDLGVRALDGDASALRVVPSALQIARERLLEHHAELIRAASLKRSPRLHQLATRRREYDMTELARLEQLLSRQDGAENGRSVLLSCLALLDGIAGDERVLPAVGGSRP